MSKFARETAVELTVQVCARPGVGPLQARLDTGHMLCGVAEVAGEFLDSDGQLLAISGQSTRVRL